MSDLRKVYLPKWMTWFGLAMVLPMWGWMTYLAFFTPDDGDDLGLVGWLVVTVVLGVVAGVLYLMGQRKLPAYLIDLEEHVEDESPGDRR